MLHILHFKAYCLTLCFAGEVGCRLDRHEIIGKGCIGTEAFRRIMNDPRLDNMPMLIETPDVDSDAGEIRLLNSLISK